VLGGDLNVILVSVGAVIYVSIHAFVLRGP
jgi:hypothetical protein